MEVGTIFAGLKFASSVACYIGIVESVEARVDKLTKSEFEAGLRALKQAANSNLERRSLLREARERFNKAVSLEKFDRLALAYLGLALCHYHLGDKDNFAYTLVKIVDMKSEIHSESLSPHMIYFGVVSLGIQAAIAIKERLNKERKEKALKIISSVEEYINSSK
ncbi:MAG: hypothetical protein AAF433_22400 [Bacteroidota bacterium]